VKRLKPDGRLMAYVLLAGGTLATIAANYAHAKETPGAKLLSAAIPCLLFVAFHVAAQDGRWHIRGLTGAVAVLCFAISYDHISGLAREYDESKVSAVLYPLAIDGAMVVATFVLSRTADRARTEDKPVPSPVRKPVRAAPSVPDAVLPAVPEDKVPVNGFHRPMPKRTERPVRADDEARLSAARKIADELGDKLSRASLVERLKEQGYPISTGAAAALVRELKAARS
jgi:Protein of unknown function (DUF2637)